MKYLTLAVALVAGLAAPVDAADVALVIGNEDYRGVPGVRRGDDVGAARRDLGRQNVNSVIGRDFNTAELREAINAFDQIANDADRMLIVLSGRFVHSPSETYFLPTNIGPPTLQSVSRKGLPMSVVLAYLSATPGQSVLGLATDGSKGNYGPFLKLGVGELNLPQGVTLIRSDSQRMGRFLTSTLARPGAVIGDAAADAGVTVSGFLSKGQTFLPAPVAQVAAPAWRGALRMPLF